jgi:hypothetical protein
MDSLTAQLIINRAWAVWSEHIGKPIYQVFNSWDAEIVIRFEKLDGAGGTLGQSEFPPYDASDTKQRTVLFDDWDLIAPKEGRAIFDFFTVAVHEFGHSLGLKHCEDDQAVMYYRYNNIKQKLTIDDICGVREKYNICSFKTGGKYYKYFTKGMKGRASENFSYSEFYTKCQFGTGHYLDSALIPAIQMIRSYYATPIKILSTYRTFECNNQAGGATYSRHLKYDGLDWKFDGRNAHSVHERYIVDVKVGGVVFRRLFEMGIRGFGGYPTSNHIDTRENANMMIYAGKFYNKWGRLNDNALIGIAPSYFGIERCEE